MTAKLLIRSAAKQDLQDAFQRMPKRYRMVYQMIRREWSTVFRIASILSKQNR